MTFKTPLWTQGASHDADVLRGIIAATLTDGVPGAGDLAVTQRGAGANMSVDVAAGLVVIDDYTCRSTSVVNLPIGAPPGVGQSRIDSVQAVYTDDNSGSGSWLVKVEPGTSSASPSAPAVPSTGVELARVTLTSSTTSITNSLIADRRPSSARAPHRTALPATGQDGQVVTLPGGSIAVRSGGGWIVHEPQSMWPVTEPRSIVGPLVKTPGSAVSLGIGVNLPASRAMKVQATITGSIKGAVGTTATDVYLRLAGTGFTAIETVKHPIRAGAGASDMRAFANTLLATIPASADPTLTAMADIFGSAEFTGVSMSVMAFPA